MLAPHDELEIKNAKETLIQDKGMSG